MTIPNVASGVRYTDDYIAVVVDHYGQVANHDQSSILTFDVPEGISMEPSTLNVFNGVFDF